MISHPRGTALLSCCYLRQGKSHFTDAGVYVLESLWQLPAHDRNIPDDVRVDVLVRDNFCCTKCGWNHKMASISDPRHHLELHHLEHHAAGGSNTAENLITVCNVCHDKLHR